MFARYEQEGQPMAGGLRAALRRMPLLRSAVRGARAWLDEHRIDVWAVRGAERHGGDDLHALLGGHLETKNYLRERLFRAGAHEIHHRAWRSRLGAIVGGRGRPDVVLLDTTDRASLQGLVDDEAIWLRAWVPTELELAVAAERMRRSDSIKSDLRKVQAQRFASAIRTDAAALERFYWELYRPYALGGFGETAVYMNREEFAAGCRHAELLEVHRDGELIAGMVILFPPNAVPHWWVLGVREGDRRLLAAGALAALYLYGVQHLMAQGYRHARLGGVRPFLDDGVLRYKRKWGARLVAGDDGDPHWLLLRIVQPTAAVRAWLAACPVIAEDAHGLIGRVFRADASAADRARVECQVAELARLGVARVRVDDLGNEGGGPGRAERILNSNDKARSGPDG